MKVCLYLEFFHFWKGILFKKIGTGLLTSYKNQKRILEHLNIAYTEKWDNSCDILQINTPWLKSVYLMKKAHRQGVKVVVWSHVTVEDAMQVFRFMPHIAPLFKKYLIYAYGLADIVFCPSEYTKSLLIAYGINPKKLHVQSNAVDIKKYFADEVLRCDGREKYKLNTITVGTVGLVIPRKGIDSFLKVARALPSSQFLWFGKIYSGFLVKTLPKILPPNVQFTGFIDNIFECYNSLDIFIFPSYEENQGMAILEAAAVGLPIVVRDIPVYQGWLVHGKNCLKAKTDEEFVLYVRQLVENVKLREDLGVQALQLAQSESIEVLAVKLKGVYINLLKI
ncbi:MAG: glycosyltransferase family 4 protein [Candidatus Paceibacterota bacterium]|jgi:1,2-diacylglycerol-3-alpha-glucose alpha-1,2-glucosyltransferase